MAQFVSGAVGTGKTALTQLKIKRLVLVYRTEIKIIVLLYGRSSADQYKYELEEVGIPTLVLSLNTSDIIHQIDETKCDVIVLFCDYIQLIITSDEEIFGLRSLLPILDSNYHLFVDDLQYFLWRACWYDSVHATNCAREVVNLMCEILNSDKSNRVVWFACNVVKPDNYINYSYMVDNEQLVNLLTLLQEHIPHEKVSNMSENHGNSKPISKLLSCVRSNIIFEHRDNFPKFLPALQYNHINSGGFTPRLYAVHENEECIVKEILDEILDTLFRDPEYNIPYDELAILAERYSVDSLQAMLSMCEIPFTTEFGSIEDKVWLGNLGETAVMEWTAAIIIVRVSDSIYNGEVKSLLSMLYLTISRVLTYVTIVVLYSDGSLDTANSLISILEPHVVISLGTNSI